LTRRPGVLVLGLGNILLGDDGVGVRVVQALEAGNARLPPRTRIVDGGTLGLELLPMLAETDSLVIVDAVELGAAHGSIGIYRGNATRSVPPPASSAHELGVSTLLETARFAGQLPQQVCIVGVQPGSIAAGTELSPAVAAAVPGAATRVRAEAWSIARAQSRARDRWGGRASARRHGHGAGTDTAGRINSSRRGG
jgi:hydrogenase maturation protease